MKKTYKKPEMEVIELNTKPNLLTTSTLDYTDETYDGEFD